MNPDISIIVPVHNTAKYLQECIDSILHQTFTDFEILLIDDGSTDHSGTMCDDFAANHSRIRVIHLENGGASVARNVGIQNACGKYITFVDSDDVLKPNFLSALHDNLLSHDADMAITNYFEYHEDDGKYYYYITDGDLGTFDLTPQQAVSMQSDWNLNGSIFIFPVVKLVKRELLANFRFPEHMMYEDEAAVHRMILACKKIVLVNDSLYLYRIHENSVMTSTVTDKRLQDLARAFKLKISDFLLAGINPVPSMRRFVRVFKDLMAGIPESNRKLPGYLECQELLNLAKLNASTYQQPKTNPNSAIVLAADAGYLIPLSTTLKSIFANGYSGTVYVMNSDISQEWFTTVNARLHKGQVQDLKVDSETLTQAPTGGSAGISDYINYMTYARIFAPQLIDADRLLYLDSDIVVDQNVTPLLNLDLEGNTIGAVIDAETGDDFNAGVLLIDAKKWREDQVTEKIWDLATTNDQALRFADQGLLNDYFGDHYLHLDPKYNYLVGTYIPLTHPERLQWTDEKMREVTGLLPAPNEAVVYHYDSGQKPWNFPSAALFREKWWRYFSLDWDNLGNPVHSPEYKWQVLIYTNVAGLRDIEELVKRMPNVQFNITSRGYIIFTLLRLAQYPNVSLFPNILNQDVDRLIRICNAMLDITDGPDEEITKRFAATGKPIIGYREDRFENILPAGSDYELVHNTGEMIDQINQL